MKTKKIIIIKNRVSYEYCFNAKWARALFNGPSCMGLAHKQLSKIYIVNFRFLKYFNILKIKCTRLGLNKIKYLFKNHLIQTSNLKDIQNNNIYSELEIKIVVL